MQKLVTEEKVRSSPSFSFVLTHNRRRLLEMSAIDLDRQSGMRASEINFFLSPGEDMQLLSLLSNAFAKSRRR